MTIDQRAALEQVARKWLVRTGLIDYADRDVMTVESRSRIEALAELLAAQRVAAIEEAATHIEDLHEKAYGTRRVLDGEGAVVTWLRQQAQEQRP